MKKKYTKWRIIVEDEGSSVFNHDDEAALNTRYIFLISGPAIVLAQNIRKEEFL